MSLIKEALDKAVEEDPDDTPVEESYRNIEESTTSEPDEPSPVEEESGSLESSQDSVMGTALIITVVVILSLVAVAQVVFLLTYFT